jgi:hypothetical protein
MDTRDYVSYWLKNALKLLMNDCYFLFPASFNDFFELYTECPKSSGP